MVVGFKGGVEVKNIDILQLVPLNYIIALQVPKR